MNYVKQPFAYMAKSYRYVYLIGTLIVLATAVFWWRQVYTNPKNVFWSAVNNNLSLKSVTTSMEQSSEAQTQKQYVQYSSNGDLKSRYYMHIKQGPNQVSTETVGTDKADYTRYTQLQAAQDSPNSKKADFSKLVNVWAKTENGSDEGATNGGSRLTVQSILGPSLGSHLLPVGNLTPQQRKDVVDQMKQGQLYKVSFDTKSVKRTEIDGRKVYIYDLEVRPVAYVAAIKQVAKYMGIHELDDLDPNDYSAFQPIKAKVTIDALSHQLVSSDNNGQVQKYSGQGAIFIWNEPKQVISGAELRKRLAETQETLQ